MHTSSISESKNELRNCSTRNAAQASERPRMKAYYTCYTLPFITQIKDFMEYMQKKVKLNIIVSKTIWSMNQSGDTYALCDY